MRILRQGRSIAFSLLDALVRLLVIRRRRNSAIIVRLDAIGDFFIWMQSGAVEVTTFAKQEGNAVIILANPSWADYARHLGLWDEVIAINPQKLVRDPLYRLRHMIKIRRLGARLFIQPRSAWIALQEDALAAVSGAETRIGNAGALINLTARSRADGHRMFNHLIEVNADQHIHETLRNAEFVAKLVSKRIKPFDFSGVHTRRLGNFVVVAMGAGQTGRIWPVRKLVEVVRHIARSQPAMRIKLLGAAAEAELAARLILEAAVPVQNLVGTTSLLEFVETIATARLVICNDSAAFHIAMALQKDVVCFLGGGHFGWFAPYPPHDNRQGRAQVLYQQLECYWCNWNCRFPRSEDGSFKCVDAITVEAATKALDEILREKRSLAP
jgi:ADP-heptose:LPS heptosyltransferase